VTNYVPRHDDVWGSGGTSSVVRSLGALLLLLLLILLLLFTAIEFSLGGSCSYRKKKKNK
jgi:hypothetical protein